MSADSAPRQRIKHDDDDDMQAAALSSSVLAEEFHDDLQWWIRTIAQKVSSIGFAYESQVSPITGRQTYQLSRLPQTPLSKHLHPIPHQPSGKGKERARKGTTAASRSRLQLPVRAAPGTLAGDDVTAGVRCCSASLADFPVELFEDITKFMPRTAIKVLRLVNKTFERGVSARFFNTEVEQFSVGIYDCRDSSEQLAIPLARKGKGKTSNSDSSVLFSNPINIDVFRSFGVHIRRYGTKFEVTEEELTKVPIKRYEVDQMAYWGQYIWPNPGYLRYKDRATLEQVADETTKMTQAFSHLTNVQELALSLDCGQGWLNGPDRSLRAQVLSSRPSVFQESSWPLEYNIMAQRYIWSEFEDAYTGEERLDDLKLSELIRLEHPQAVIMPEDFQDRIEYPPVPGHVITNARHAPKDEDFHLGRTEDRIAYSQLMLHSRYGGDNGRSADLAWIAQMAEDSDNHDEAVALEREREIHLERERRKDTARRALLKAPGKVDNAIQCGVVFPALSKIFSTLPAGHAHGRGTSRPPILVDVPPTGSSDAPTDVTRVAPTDVAHFDPNHLTKAQLEWLLETAWAQEAFLASYMLAVEDNPIIFASLKTLTLTRVSSCHLPKLTSANFWNTLSGLMTLEIRVITDWRTIRKNDLGCAVEDVIPPSTAVETFNKLLSQVVAPKDTITSLTIGWVDGGENAEGMGARNEHILPAPIILRALVLHTGDHFKNMVVFRHVKKLRLVNCWATPNLLTSFIKAQKTLLTEEIILESVSLTTHPAIPINPALPALGNVHLHVLPQMPLPPPAAGGQGLQGMQQMPFAITIGTGPNPIHLTAHPLVAAQISANPTTTPITPRGVRVGSWPDVLYTLRDHAQLSPGRHMRLRFLSCGYVRLQRATFDQTALIDAIALRDAHGILHGDSLQDVFDIRWRSLAPLVQRSDDALLGSLSTAIPVQEDSQLGLVAGMALHPGWPRAGEVGGKYDDEEGWGKWGVRSELAAEFDGAKRGGTGRFSGVIEEWAEE